MGHMNVCGNESMKASESSSITHNPLNQLNCLSNQDHQNGDIINEIFSLLEQQNFNINSFENQMEDQNSTDFVQACFSCSTILKADMSCLQLSENCQL
jgi:hypothetical protein